MKLCWEATGSGVMCEGSPYISGDMKTSIFAYGLH